MDYLLNGLPYFPGSTIFGTGLFADGTAAAPSISFAAQTNKGFYSPAANQVGLSLNGGLVFTFRQDGGVNPYILGAGGQFMQFLGAGGVNLTAAGSAQNITLTPSTTGTADIFNDVSSLVQLRLGAGNVSYWGIGRDNTATGDLLIRSGTSEKARFTNSTGRLLLGTTTDSGALLQVGTNTITAAGGMVFGTDCFLYRSAATVLRLETAGNYAFEVKNSTGIGSACMSFVNTTGALFIGSDNSSGSAMGSGIAYAGVITTTTSVPLVFRTSGVTAVTIDTSQRTILSGALRLGNAYVAGAVVGTGYVTIQDSTGTTYRVPVLV
jgi:hypothetical protein